MRRRRPRRPAGGPYRKRHHGLTLLLLVVAGVTRTVPATAQPTTGTAATGTAPSGSPPDILPPVPSGPFGFPNPLAPPNALPNGITPAAPEQAPYSLALPPPGAGITTLQQYDPNTPAILIQPTASIGETLYDNVNYTPSDRTAAAETRLIPGVSISADTPRLQGVLSASVEGDAYTPTSNLDQFLANLYASGTGTIIPDRLFVDVRSIITQASALPGLGFVNPSLLPRNQQTQVYANTVSPYLRQSFDGMVDTELRYRFGSSNFGGNTSTVSSTLTPATTNLASGILNEGTFTASTGQNFQRAGSRLTIDAQSFNSSSTSRNSQFSSFDDLQYQITPDIAALGRIGYQNIQYPFAPAATFVGPTWLVGGRLGLGGNYGYVSLEYGVQQGVYGFTGSALYQVTPTITVTASLVQGISSPAEFLQTSLASSTLSPNGAIVDQNSGLPTSFYNPGVGLTNGVYRQHLFNAQVSDTIGPNSYSLYGYYSIQTPLTPPITAPTKSLGAYLAWNRDIKPDLNGTASVGYSDTGNAVSAVSLTPISTINTLTANIGVNYLFGRNLTGSVLYTLSYQPNGGTLVSGRSGDILANSLQFLLTKAF
jgi:uncharacterized protein (PEP-CTERM system associated)